MKVSLFSFFHHSNFESTAAKLSVTMDSELFNKPTTYEGSSFSIRPELNSFNLPTTDISELYTTALEQVFPSLSIRDSNNPLEFSFTSSENNYINLANSYLALTTKIVKAYGNNCLDADKVAPSNLFFHLLFKNLEIYINGKCVVDTQNFYSFQAYITRLLNTPKSIKDTILQNELCYPNSSF